MSIAVLGAIAVSANALPLDTRPEAYAGSEGDSVSAICRLDTRASPRPVFTGQTLLLRYDALWNGAGGSSVRISLGGETFATPAGAGAVAWSVPVPGFYEFTHVTVRGGADAGPTLEASFIARAAFEAAGWAGVYDGLRHGISVETAIPGAAVLYATAEGGPYSEEAPTRKDAGTTAVWFVVEAPGLSPQTNMAEISVSPRPLAVTAHDKRKTAGDPDPALTWSAPDLVAGDSLSGELVRDEGEAVGSYSIRRGTLAASPNYEMSFAGARFEIVPANTIVSATARQRYPWNGLVDVDVAFGGPSGEHYRIELSARDEAGETNLPVQTAWLEGAPGAVGNPVDVPAPGTHRLVWNAEADLPTGFVADSVTISAKLLDPVWSFEIIPAIDPNDEWAPETVYHDVQTVAAYGEIEDRTPTIRCLTDEWNLADKLGANVVFSGASMGLRFGSDFMEGRGVTNPIALWTVSAATNRARIVTLDYETGRIACDAPIAYAENGRNDARFFAFKGDPRAYAVVKRGGYDAFWKSAGMEANYVHLGNRYADDETGSALCSYFPKGIPVSDATSTTVPSAHDKDTRAAVFFCGETGTDRKQVVVHAGGSPAIDAESKYSCMKNPTGRYVVPMLDGRTYFTVGHGAGDTNAVQTHRVFFGDFAHLGDEIFDLHPTGLGTDWVRDPEIAYSKAVAMPDGVRFFFGGAGRDADGTIKMWCGGSGQYSGEGLRDDPAAVTTAWHQERVFAKYPAGHPFESWARRDVTCLLPNGKFCGVDEELGLVVVNPLTGETYVASDDPAFKKGKMGCQLLPNGKVWIVPYDCDGREFEYGRTICGKLYEVDFGFTRSFSLSSLLSPYLRVAEGDPEPSGVKVGLDPNGGELPDVFAQYYKGESPVYGELPVPTRSDYTFLGWSTDGTAANMVSATDPVPSSGIRLKAAWALDHRGIQLWEGGPYWAETNIGAENPWDYGYYFWWGDTIGYKRENNAWIASDGSSQNYSFLSGNTLTYGKDSAALQSEGWITADGVLAPEHDAAQAHWDGSWRMPTQAECSALVNKCVWTYVKTNGVYGCVVSGRDDFADASIFLPAARSGYGTSLEDNLKGFYWSSVPAKSGSSSACSLEFYHSAPADLQHYVYGSRYRFQGQVVRPVRDGN